jgi:hypothetical protein
MEAPVIIAIVTASAALLTSLFVPLTAGGAYLLKRVSKSECWCFKFETREKAEKDPTPEAYNDNEIKRKL